MGTRADLVDVGLWRDAVGFAVRSLGRHPWLALGLTLAVVGAAGLGLAVLPRTWHAEARLLAQRNRVIALLGNPGRSVPRDEDAPTRAAGETVLRHDHLVALVKQTNLLDHWRTGRAPLLRFEDALVERLRGPPSDEDLLAALVALLEKRLTVTTGGEGVVTLGVDWPDPQVAQRLVETAQQNFLEARHRAEVSAIAEAISILESHAADLRRHMREAGAELARAEGRQTVRAVPEARAGDERELAPLQALLEARRRAIVDLEAFRRRRLAELQGRLAELRATYAARHPVRVNAEAAVATLQADSPELEALRGEVRELEAELTRRRSGSVRPAPVVERAEPDVGVHADAAARLHFAENTYHELQRRIDAARIELDTARAAFKYRYSVLKPARLPREPERPRPVPVLLGGLVAGLALALFACVSQDVRAGRVLEPWQLERGLGVPVLGEVERP